MRGEFDLIARYFAPLAAAAPGADGLRNDAALLDLGPDETLVVTVDAMVEGVHFLPEDPPDLVARKLLRVNLSDLAAMGARPRSYVMTTAFPHRVDEAWIEAFAEGLAADQRAFGVTLVGGDTVATPGPLSLSLTAFGVVPRGRALARATARAGDLVYVSGTIGDGALGLKAIRGELPDVPAPARAALIDRYRLPEPRLALGRALVETGLASAAIDLSDGLVADLGHVAETSGLAAEIQAGAVPLSDAAGAALTGRPGLRRSVLSGGDDYELLFTAAPGRAGEVADLAAALGLPLSRVGRLLEGQGIRVLDEAGQEIARPGGGWSHF
ncbi:MAG: thiamine-phosphate kinase [Kiloniellaceae bacterium]